MHRSIPTLAAIAAALFAAGALACEEHAALFASEAAPGAQSKQGMQVAPSMRPALHYASAKPNQEPSMILAKRAAAPAVEAVEADGVRYEVLQNPRLRGFAYNGGVLLATDSASGKELWTLTVYQKKYDQQLEKDVQDVHISGLKRSKDGKILQVDAEDGKSYLVNLADRSVKPKL